MFILYILKSKKDNDIYIGVTPNLRKRLHEHNSGKAFATKFRLPFKLIYCEVYKDKHDAFNREKMLKYHGQGLRRLKERLTNSLS